MATTKTSDAAMEKEKTAGALSVNTAQPLTNKNSRDSIGSEMEYLAPATATTEKGATAQNVSTLSTPATVRCNPFETDLEAAIPSEQVTTSRSRQHLTTSTSSGGSDCQVWPSAAQWKQKAKAAKFKSRSRCDCLAGLSKRNRTIVKVLIVVLLIGAAVGIGLGVSKPLGAGIWNNGPGNRQS